MGEGLLDWLLVAGQGLAVALFVVFFYLVIRLWLHLADADFSYNPARAPEGTKKNTTGFADDPEKPPSDQGSGT